MSAAPRRVLVVDDNADVAETMASVITLLGAETRTAADGMAALACMEAWAPHLVFMDVGMPGLSGPEVVQQARQHAWGARITMIAVTGSSRAEDRALALDAGFDLYVVKPVELGTLRTLLAAADDSAEPQ